MDMYTSPTTNNNSHHHHHRRPSGSTGFCHWMSTIKMSRLIGLGLACLFAVTMIVHYSLPSSSEKEDTASTHRSRNKLEALEPDLTSLKFNDLKFQIEELKRIKASVNNELRELESKRQKLHSEISHYNTQIEMLKNDFEKSNFELEQLRVTIQNTKLEKEELEKNREPLLTLPKRVLPSAIGSVSVPPPKSPWRCRMHNCFDVSRCSLTSGFPVYLYSVSDGVSLTDLPLDKFIKTSIDSAIDQSGYRTFGPHEACLYVVIIGDTENGLHNISSKDIALKLSKLPYWRGDGRNHLLINLARHKTNFNPLFGVDTGRALIAQSDFAEDQFRPGFDLVVTPSLGPASGDVWHQIPRLVPAHRKHLLTFQGEFVGGHLQGQDGALLEEQETFVVKTLKSVQVGYPDDNFTFEFSCNVKSDKNIAAQRVGGEWILCGTDTERYDLLKQSTFSLIIAPLNYSSISTTIFQTRIYESLKNGAIPVMLGNQIQLPFSELLQWKQVSLTLPKARASELHFLLRTWTDADILETRRRGRLFFETYLGTTQSLIDTVLATVRTRLGLPPRPIVDEPSPSVFANVSFVPLRDENPIIIPAADAGGGEQDTVLGPVETPFPSPRFLRNYTFGRVDDGEDLWNSARHPFHLFPASPFAPTLPSEAKFIGSEFGFRPIGKGMGGAGKEFSEALGGNHPREQFTIVMLTYEREAVLLNAIARLKGLPHLNKVIVVWNSPNMPQPDLRWPEINVPVHVVKTAKNSLNNRFLPYDAIETDAILSIDDDAHLRHDEIMFGFRVWREARERIVGFPGRFHAWDTHNWNYNSNYSCELSMVLTGAAFFHKYYSYLYSTVMPQAIRDKVDEFINCEDLAMNFLIAHVTRKPPIKVTSRWTFRCPGCPAALSVDEEHFHERHQCMNFLTSVYGYMPLLNTQFRADSVLFKTRIPHEKQKCFKFI